MDNLSKESLVTEGEVECVTFYTKSNGNHITKIRLKGATYSFLDWNHRIRSLPKVGDLVRISYHEWVVRNIKDIGFHHVIESLEIKSTSATILDFAVTLSVGKNGNK
jgi:hypothetical protein